MRLKIVGSFSGLKLFDRSYNFSRFLPDRLPGEDDVACVPLKPPSSFRHQRSPPEVIKGRSSTHREAPLGDSAEQQEPYVDRYALAVELDSRGRSRKRPLSLSFVQLPCPKRRSWRGALSFKTTGPEQGGVTLNLHHGATDTLHSKYTARMKRDAGRMEAFNRKK